MWFSENDFIFNTSLKKENIYGYVLPHAGTAYTGTIYTHTLQYIPKNMNFTNVYIFYYPATASENVSESGKKYYHEYYVPMKSLKHVFKNWWKIGTKQFIGVNVRDSLINMRDFNLDNNLIIISADFSHYLENMNNAIEIENKAALSLMFKTHHESQKHVDTMKQFEYVFNRIPETHVLRWVGRTRSPGVKAVGYLSFFITKQHKPNINKIDGYFITAYDEDMNARECLGKWEYSKSDELLFLEHVKNKAQQTSRLTGGRYTEIPVKYYKITYLYADKGPFSRGYHGVKTDAFYLPEVFLENSYEDGTWIKTTDTQWKHPTQVDFDMTETLYKLSEKAGTGTGQKKTPQFFKGYMYYGTY